MFYAVLLQWEIEKDKARFYLQRKILQTNLLI